MAFFQKPSWCENEKYKVFLIMNFYKIFLKDNCTGINNQEKNYIITSKIPYMNHLSFTTLECILMIFLILNKILARKFKHDKKSNVRLIILSSLFVITVVNDILCCFIFLPFQINCLIRPIFFTLYQ